MHHSEHVKFMIIIFIWHNQEQKYVPNCDVSFANGEVHQAYGHVTLTMSAWPKYGHRSLEGYVWWSSPLANETSQLDTYILRYVVLYEYDYQTCWQEYGGTCLSLGDEWPVFWPGFVVNVWGSSRVWSRETRSSYSLCDVTTGDAMRKFTLCRLLFLLSFNGICGSAVVVRPHHSTTFIDAAYCYRRSSMFCLSVLCLTQLWALWKPPNQARLPLGCELWWAQRTIY